MKAKNPADSDPATPTETGLTAQEIERATAATDTELNLNCSNFACYIAINEFELIFLASN